MKNISNGPIADRSKRKMASALIELMKQKSYNSITVKEVCAKAGLVRQTFYTNFTAKQDIIKYYLDSVMIDIEREYIKPDSTTKDILFGVFSYCEKHLSDYRALVDNGFTGLMIDRLTLKNRILSGKFGAGVNNKYYEAFYSGAIFSVVVCWLQSSFKPTAHEMTNLTIEILKSADGSIF